VGLSLIAAAGAMAAELIAKGTQVPVISGGIGQESLARLKAREKEFNLKLVFALAEGNYLADVGVTVSDASGKVVVDHVTDGPVLLARLPAGTYTVIARYEGRVQTRKVTLRSEPLLTEHLRWPSDPRVDFPGPGNGRKSEPPSRPEAGRTATTTLRESAAPSAVAFVSGGIGEASQAQLLAREREFNLKLVFTLVEGNYVADTRVEIRDAAGRSMLSHVTDGPFFLARLPAGTYTVTASYEAQEQTRKVAVTADRLRTEYIRWKSNPQTDLVLPPER
jgi:hypothetical protein